MTTSTYDVAISAVSYDSILVAELCDRLAGRIRGQLFWRGDRAGNGGEHTAESVALENTRPLLDEARVTLVLHQRLWSHDAGTKADEAALRQRARKRPRSIRIVALDDEPVPSWMASLQTCSFGAVGMSGAVDFVADAVAACGGDTVASPSAAAPEAVNGRWGESPQPFLAQPRALSSLRRELDALAAELEPCVKAEKDRDTGRVAKLTCSPQRLVAQVGDIGLSFSWVAGRTGTVADGRLLVIEWAGVVTCARGMGDARTASPARERLYRAEATSPDTWRWRAADPDGGAYSTSNLAGQWFASALIAADRLAAAIS